MAPIYRGRDEDAELLRSATSLRIAEELEVRSIAFPSLGTGAYGYPIERAAAIATGAVAAHARTDTKIVSVQFVLFSEGDLAAYEAALAREAP